MRALLKDSVCMQWRSLTQQKIVQYFVCTSADRPYLLRGCRCGPRSFPRPTSHGRMESFARSADRCVSAASVHTSPFYVPVACPLQLCCSQSANRRLTRTSGTNIGVAHSTRIAACRACTSACHEQNTVGSYEAERCPPAANCAGCGGNCDRGTEAAGSVHRQACGA